MISNHQGTSYSKQKLFSIKQSVSTWQRVLHFIVLICPLSLISITGCEANYEPWVTPDKVLVPMDVGNWWEYEVRITGGPLYFRETVFETIQVPVQGEIINAGAIATDNGTEPPYKWLRTNGPNGLYVMGGVAPKDSFYTLAIRYKYPAKVGDTWNSPQLSFSRSSHTFYQSNILEITLVDDDRVVVTPAGTFNCYVYKFSQQIAYDVPAIWDYYMYYSPGVGFVMQQTYSQPSGSLKDETVLLRYNVNGQNNQ